MKRLDEIRNTLVKYKEELGKEWKVKEIGIFGSYIRGKQKKQSDVDLLVEFDENSDLTFLDFIRLENYLSDLLGVKVDLVEKQTLKQRIGKHVLSEVVNV